MVILKYKELIAKANEIGLMPLTDEGFIFLAQKIMTFPELCNFEITLHKNKIAVKVTNKNA